MTREYLECTSELPPESKKVCADQVRFMKEVSMSWGTYVPRSELLRRYYPKVKLFEED